MERQDELLVQLDQLNANIESMIQALTAQRVQESSETKISQDESPTVQNSMRAAA
jgi:hypothetical protein